MPATAPDRVRWAGPALVATVLLSLYVLFWPEPSGSGVRVPGADKAVHLLLFAVLAGAARLRLGARPRALAAVLGYAAASEVVQAVVLTSRSGDLLDLVADAAGAVLGWLVADRWLTRRHGRVTR